jgi:hypothetical protein
MNKKLSTHFKRSGIDVSYQKGQDIYQCCLDQQAESSQYPHEEVK